MTPAAPCRIARAPVLGRAGAGRCRRPNSLIPSLAYACSVRSTFHAAVGEEGSHRTFLRLGARRRSPRRQLDRLAADIADELGLASDYGLLVVRVVPGSSAERAGLRGGTERAYLGNTAIMIGGDLIVAVDNQEVQDQQQLEQIMTNHRAGDTVRVTLYRGKRKIDLNITLGEAREQV